MHGVRNREEKPFLEHLEDLRQTIFRCLVALGIGMAIAFPVTPQILDLLKAPLAGMLDDPDRFLQSLEVAGAFTVALRVSMWAGLLLSAPFLAFFIGQFVFPGLTEREKSLVYKVGGVTVALFFFGVFMGYIVTLQVALKIMYRLHDWLGIKAAWRVNDYVAFTVRLLIAFGLAFEMPVVLVLLGKLGIVNANQLREKRRHAIVLFLVLAMFLTPPDPFTQLAMAIPLTVLYEAGIWIVRATEKREQRILR